jgi:cellulose synthase/poly-beta-1,6-N-acetylglucosamine synthase-like glycosyltransferase
MKTAFFLSIAISSVLYLIVRLLRLRPSRNIGMIEAIVPAYNEEPCIARTVVSLLRNRYIRRVICVDDGSTDCTVEVLRQLAARTPRLTIVVQQNSGKGGAIMNGLKHVTAPYVFLTDADTIVPAQGDDLGFLQAEIENGADAVGGVPSSNLRSGGLLPHIRATVKCPMIIAKRTFQQILGGAPFIISGACGLFRTEVLREVGLSDRTKVEDLDLTWTLVARGYKVRQSSFCIVYPQECHTLREEWLRWRRWIRGYAVCMRLHWRLLFSRFGLFSILPMFAVVVLGLCTGAFTWVRAVSAFGPLVGAELLFPVFWMFCVLVLGTISAFHHAKARLVVMAPLAIVYVLLAYAVWLTHGIRGLTTGRELSRDKPTRYAYVVA